MLSTTKFIVKNAMALQKNNCISFKYTYNVVDSIRSCPGVWPMSDRLDVPRLVFVAFLSGT